MLNDFSVTYERIDDSEAAHGGTTRHGIVESGLSLRDALDTARREVCAASESRGTYANDSEPRHVRWISFEYFEYETGDCLIVSIHFPEHLTGSTRKRLIDLLT